MNIKYERSKVQTLAKKKNHMNSIFLKKNVNLNLISQI